LEQETTAKIREGRKPPQVEAAAGLAREWRRERVRESLLVWRWPAGVLAGLVLWLALVTVVGAAPPAAPRSWNPLGLAHVDPPAAAWALRGRPDRL
jgi:hypothetical protein